MKNFIQNTDWKLLFLYFVLITFGLLNVYSVSEDLGQKQLIWACISLTVLVIISISNLIFLEIYSIIFYLIGIFLLLGLFVLGKEINGAKAWYSFGSFSFQPAEAVKLFVALFLSFYAQSKFDYFLSLKNIVISLIIIGIPAVLILFQPDFGSVIIFSSFLIPLYREGLTGYTFLLILFLSLLFLFSLIYPSAQVMSLLLICVSLYILYLFRNSTTRNKDMNYNLYLSYFIGSSLFYVGLFIYSISLKQIPESIVIIGTLINFLGLYLIYSYQNQSEKVNKGKMAQFSSIFSLVILILFIVSFSSNTIFNQVLKSHQKERLLVLIEGESKYRDTSGYNLLYAKTAIGSGELFGKGYKNGSITSGKFVPEQQTDYIFTTVGEEWGFLGSAILIIVYCLFIGRIFTLAENQKSRFSRFYGYSIASIFLLHFALNISMVMGLFPTVGVPLPYFSYGGTSFLAFSVMFYIFLKLNYQNNSYLV